MIGDKKKFGSRGFTLLETVVALGIFSVVLLASFSAFIMTLRVQRAILTEKAMSENINYALEFMSRQMRVAKRDGGGICIVANTTYETSLSTEIKFINGNDECVRFFLSSGAIQYENITGVSGVIPLTTSTVVSVNTLDFSILGEVKAPSDFEQPRATITIQASGVGGQPEVQSVRVEIQTTVVARGLDV